MTSTPVENFNTFIWDLSNPQDNKPTDYWSKKSSRTTEQEDLQINNKPTSFCSKEDLPVYKILQIVGQNPTEATGGINNTSAKSPECYNKN